MQRYGQLIGVKPEHVERYEQLHEQVWPEVLDMIRACNIRNYTIFRHGTLLFAYFEYIGDDFAVDMAKMAADPKTQEWWSHTDPLQEPVADRAEGEWWATMRPIFHTD
jgi:L-rhamnose mutarotase